MATCHCCATDQKFDRSVAEKDLRRFLRRGPDKPTQRLLDAILTGSLPTGPTLLDIGGGIGTLHHTLLAHGFAHATQIDASQAYLAVSAAEAERRGHSSKVTFLHGEFQVVAATTPAADVVTLDRVVCCDPDYAGMLAAAADHAGHLLALSYPRTRWAIRAFVALTNAARRVRRHPFRTYLHPPAAMTAVLEGRGLRRRWAGGTWIWRVELFERAA